MVPNFSLFIGGMTQGKALAITAGSGRSGTWRKPGYIGVHNTVGGYFPKPPV